MTHLDPKRVQLTVEAVKRSHFFTQPLDVPIVFGKKDMFSLVGNFPTEIYDGQLGRSAPDAAEFVDAGC